jgi:hypothetical protein
MMIKTWFICSALILAVAACSDDSPPPENAPFLGDWETVDGTGTFSCDDGQVGGLTATPGYILTLNPGTEDTDVTVELRDDCALAGFRTHHGLLSNTEDGVCSYTTQHPTYGRVDTNVVQAAGTTFIVNDEVECPTLQETGVRKYDFLYVDYQDGFRLKCTLTYQISYRKCS